MKLKCAVLGLSAILLLPAVLAQSTSFARFASYARSSHRSEVSTSKYNDQTEALTTWRQFAELTDTSQVIGDETGESVAVRGDAVVVAAPGIAPSGAALVFVRPGTGWQDMTQTAKLTPSDGAPGGAFGEAVAIGKDTIVVSAQNISTVYLFVKPADGWKDMTETAKLTASVHTSRFGLALAVTGNTVVVGAYGTNQEGSAYVYVKPKTGWHDMQQTAELLATEKGDFGLAVAASGPTVAVGAPTARSQSGLIYLYVKPIGGWKDVGPTAVLTTSDGGGGNFGGALAMTGQTIISGAAFGGDARTGEGYIYVKPADGWTDMTETAKLNAPSGAQLFGNSVSIFGNTALVGAAFTAPGGAAYVFVRPKTGWVTTSTPKATLRSLDNGGGDLFGVSVSMGQVAVIGASQHNSLRGAAYVYGR